MRVFSWLPMTVTGTGFSCRSRKNEPPGVKKSRDRSITQAAQYSRYTWLCVAEDAPPHQQRASVSSSSETLAFLWPKINGRGHSGSG